MGRAATDELCVELGAALSTLLAVVGPTRPPMRSPRLRALQAAPRHLTAAPRRGRGDVPLHRRVRGARARGGAMRSAELSLLRADLLELARERVESGATPTAPEHMLTSLVRLPIESTDEAPEIAAALRLLRRAARGRGLRRARRPAAGRACARRARRRRARRRRGGADRARPGRRRRAGRDGRVGTPPRSRSAPPRSSPSFRSRPRTRSADRCRARRARSDARRDRGAAEPGDELLARRLDERMREIAHTVLLLVAARRRSPAIRARPRPGATHAARERARTLAVIETTLPRALVSRLVDAVEI